VRPLHLLVVAVVVASPGLAHAQSSAAEALFEQGRAALAQGDLDTACARFRASDEIEPAAGTRANLADCEERRGRVATAWEAYRSALDKLPSGDKRAPVISQRIANLEARLPRLVLALAASAPKETTVRDGGATIGATATYGVPLPLDPGVHHLLVSAPGRRTQAVDVDLAEGRTLQVTVAPGAAADGGGTATPASAEQASPGPWIVGGIGVAGLVVGAVTGALVLHDKSAADAGCSDVTKTCTPDAKAAADAGRSLGPVTTVALVAGAAGVAAGAIWLGVRGSGQPRVSVGVAPIGAGVAWKVDGSW
jgi:hypothetical protein